MFILILLPVLFFLCIFCNSFIQRKLKNEPDSSSVNTYEIAVPESPVKETTIWMYKTTNWSIEIFNKNIISNNCMFRFFRCFWSFHFRFMNNLRFNINVKKLVDRTTITILLCHTSKTCMFGVHQVIRKFEWLGSRGHFWADMDRISADTLPGLLSI